MSIQNSTVIFYFCITHIKYYLGSSFEIAIEVLSSRNRSYSSPHLARDFHIFLCVVLLNKTIIPLFFRPPIKVHHVGIRKLSNDIDPKRGLLKILITNKPSLLYKSVYCYFSRYGLKITSATSYRVLKEWTKICPVVTAPVKITCAKSSANQIIQNHSWIIA